MINIYALTDPRNGEVRYVGKTKYSTEYRRKAHIRHARYGHIDTHCYRWIRQLLKDQLEPEGVLLEKCEEANWKAVERKWIRHYKDSGSKLTNLTNGGDGPNGTPRPDEVREKIRRSLQGKKHSPERVQKNSEIRKGKPPWNKGKRGVQTAWNKGMKNGVRA